MEKEEIEKFESKLEETIDKAIYEHRKREGSFPPIGPSGGGLYHLGRGCYTGKQGWLEFEKLMKEEDEKLRIKETEKWEKRKRGI
jgi:hypothetical protein